MFFISLTSSGLPLILSRKIAEMRNSNKLDEYKKVTFCLIFSLVSCSIIAIGLILAKPMLYIFFQNSKAVSVFYILLPALFTTTFYSIIRAWFLGNKQFLTFSSTELLEEVSRIILTFIFVLTITNITSEKIIALAVTCADFICVIVLLILYFCKGGRLILPDKNFDLIKSSVPITMSRIFGSLIGAFSAFIIPYKLIEYGMTTSLATASFGRFTGMCMPLLNAPSALIGSVAVVLIPELASLKNVANNNIQQKIESSLTFSVATAGLFVCLYMPLGKEITELVFNDTASGEYLTICSVIIFPLVICQLTTSLLNTLNREKITLINYIAGNIPMILILIFLPKYIGILSVGLGLFVSFVITAILNIIALNKVYKLSSKCFTNMLLAIIYSLILGFLLGVISNKTNLSNIINIILCGLIGVILYSLLCYFSGFISKDILRSATRKKQ